MQGLLRHVLDHNKHVQEAACSALATLEEQSIPEHLVTRLKVILETLAKACATYGRKNLRILYDAIKTLAELMGDSLAEPSLLRLYMPPLVAKWQSLADTDRDLLPLLECFTSVALAIGEPFSLLLLWLCQVSDYTNGPNPALGHGQSFQNLKQNTSNGKCWQCPFATALAIVELVIWKLSFYLKFLCQACMCQVCVIAC